MRITNNTIGDRVLADLQRSYTRLSRTQEQISSGRRVNRPSDDPVAAGQERLRTGELEGIKRSQDSVAGAQSWLGAAEKGLSTVNGVLARANELAVQAANASTGAAGRASIALEIDQLVKSAKDAMNTKFGDSYIFSGTKGDTAPYGAATGDAYQGDTGAVIREAGAGVQLQLNGPFVPLNATPAGATAPVTALSVLGNGPVTPPAVGDGRVLDALETFAAHLRGGTPADLAAIQSTDIQALQANQKAVGDARAVIGASLNRADAAAARLDDLESATNQSLDDLTGVDLAKAITDFTAQQSAYQAALKVGAQVIQPSLVEFLR